MSKAVPKTPAPLWAIVRTSLSADTGLHLVLGWPGLLAFCSPVTMRADPCRGAHGLRQSLRAPAPPGPSSRRGRARLSRRTDGPWRRAWAVVWLVVVACGVASAVHAAPPSQGTPATLHIAATLTLSGDTAAYGRLALEGAQLAVEEANATGTGPAIDLLPAADRGTPAGGQEAARQLTASDALVVVGPSHTVVAVEAGAVYADAGLACVTTTAGGDTVTQHATIFRASYLTSALGESLAHYLRYALRGTRAAVIVKEDEGYGEDVAAGFRRAAERLGITTTYHPFSTTAEVEAAAQRVAADPAHPAVILAMLLQNPVPAVITLRRQKAQGPILGPTSIAGEFFADLFKDQPEERQQPGFFTDGIYATLPLLFDSGNAATLALANRYRARFGREPTFIVAQGYEAARIAIAAVRATAAQTLATADRRTRREAIRTYLSELDRPERGVEGLNGPLWFTPERGRQQPLRVGRFHGAAFESAPLQLTPVPTPDPAELASGAVFAVEPGRYARLQRAVYTGVFINEIARLDLTRSSFNADFYLWVRFARDAGQSPDDPTDLTFPTLLSGTFDRTRPAAQRTLPDGTEYRLWRVQGEFRNDFDLRRFPFDTQTLTLRFGNARGDMYRIV